MRAEVEVELTRVADTRVNCRSRRDVSAYSMSVPTVRAEQPGVVTFLDNYVGDAWLITYLQVGTCGPDCSHFVREYLIKCFMLTMILTGCFQSKILVVETKLTMLR